MQALLDVGIAIRRGVATWDREPAYKNIVPSLSLLLTEDTYDNNIIIPLYVPMDKTDVDTVIREMRRVF
jgi:hypothetical protein